MENLLRIIDSWPHGLQVMVLLGVAFVAGVILAQLIFAVARWNARRTASFLQQTINRHLRAPLTWFIPLLLMVIAIDAFREEESLFWLAKLLEILLYVSFAWILVRVVSVVADSVRKQYSIESDENLHERKILTQLQYIQRIIVIAIFFVTVSFILLQFESVREIGAGLLTSAGVAGIIIGFAAQKSIANLLAGLQIAFTQPIRLDDVVIVEGEFGRVEEITLTYIVLRLWDQRRLVVPLQHFIDNVFQNWTRTGSELIGTVFVYADYSMPIGPIRRKVDEILADHPKWDKRVKAVQVTDAKPDVLEVRVLVSARDSGSLFDLRCDVREQLVTFIREGYPEGLPQTRVLFSQQQEHTETIHAKEGNGEQKVMTSSPSAEDGKEELPPGKRI